MLPGGGWDLCDAKDKTMLIDQHRSRSRLAMLAFVATLAAGSALAGPRPITDFEALMSALQAGETVKVVVDYGRCDLIVDNHPETAPQAVGGMVIDVWEYFAAGSIGNAQAFLAFSHGSLIQHARRGMVINHVKFRVMEDGKVTIGARYLDPVTYEETMFQNLFTTIADGEQGAAAFFRQD